MCWKIIIWSELIKENESKEYIENQKQNEKKFDMKKNRRSSKLLYKTNN